MSTAGNPEGNGTSRGTAPRRRARKVQNALYRISEATQTAEDLGELYRQLHAIIGELMPAQNFYLALCDKAEDLLIFPYYVDEYDTPPPPQKPGRGLTEYVLRTGQPLLASSEFVERLIADGQVEDIGAPSVDWLGVPLIVQKEISGVMVLQSYDPQVRYCQADLDILSFVSSQVAMAIERKQDEQTIRLSEARYRSLVETQSDLITRSDPDGKLTFVNEAYCRMFGKARPDILGKTIGDTVLPQDIPVSQWALATCQSPPYRANAEMRHKTPHGIRWIRWDIAAVVDAEGNIHDLQGAGRDITYSKRAEEVLRESEEKYRNLVERANDAIVIIQDGMVKYGNQRLAELWGGDLDEVFGSPFIKFIHPEVLPTIMENYRRRMAGEAIPAMYETILRRKDGSPVYVEINAGVTQFQNKPADLVFVRDITERKQAQEAIREHEQRFRTLFENLPAASWSFDRDGRILDWNRASQELYGWNAEQAIGKTMYELMVMPENVTATRRTIAAVFGGQSFAGLEYTDRKADGSSCDVLVSEYPIQDASGQVVMGVCAEVDITQIKRAELELRLSEEKYRNVVQMANDGILITVGSELTFANQRLAEMWGGTVEEMIGTDYTDYLHPDERPYVMEYYKSRITGENTPGIYETRLMRKDGSYIAAELSIGLVPYRGQMADLIIVRDITERKQAQEALQESEIRFRTLFENLPAASWSFDRDGRILDWNRASQELYGWSAEQAIGKTMYELIVKPENEAATRRMIADVFNGKSFAGQEYIDRKADGSNCVVLVNNLPILDVNGQVVMGVCTEVDITARKEAEEQARKLSRLYQVISQVNQVLVRAAEEVELTQQVCQVLVDYGGYRLVWLGLAVDDEAKSVLPVAVAGFDNGYVSSLNLTWADVERGRGPTSTAIRTGKPSIAHNISTEPGFAPWREQAQARGYASTISLPLRSHGQAFGSVQLYSSQPEAFDEEEIKLLSEMADDLAFGILSLRERADLQRADAEIKELNQDLLRRAEQLGLLYKASLTLNSTLNHRKQLEALFEITMQALHADRSGYYRYDARKDEVYYEFGVGRGADLPQLRSLRVKVGEERGLIGLVAQQRKLLYIPDVSLDPRWVVTDPEIRSALWVPVKRENQLMGLLAVGSQRLDAFSKADQQLLELLASQVAVSIDNAQLFENALSAVERRATLHWLSQEIITIGAEPDKIYQAIHQATGKLMSAEAFVISLLDEKAGEIEVVFSMDKGRRYPNQRVPRQRGLTSHILSSGKSLIIHDVETEISKYNAEHFGGPGSVSSILAVPMRHGERVLGMLSTQSYQPYAFTEEDQNLLEILAAYAAIALENARLFTEMQNANLELSTAYEETIAGWSKALELRDKETKGHSERVIRLTLRLAGEAGLPEEMIAPLRHGVLLHDIGKMAIPDHILLKPGPLTDEEWLVIRQHPVYAYQLLSGIPFLSKAIDIPYCHHENWDGTGYPNGIEGEEIPIGARLFALVDVWDALTSDRPYRPAWTMEATRSYILAQSGKRFDPQLVTIFLKLLEAGELLATTQ